MTSTAITGSNNLITPVRDFVNESFHEHRPSFRTLVATFDDNGESINKKKKGSFTYEITKKPDVSRLMKEKSIRQSFNSSFVSSFGSGLDLITEEASIASGSQELQISASEHAKNESEMANILSELTFEQPVPEQPATRRNNDTENTRKKKKKKREPKFIDDPFHSHYDLGTELGSGAYAVVKIGTHKKSKKEYAIKIVEIDNMDDADLDALQIEISVMSKLKHDNIIRLYETFCEDSYYYLVTEKMMGGELLDRIVQKTYYNEKEARDTCRILFKAMQYCHSKNVAHRDLKPENLLLTSNDCDSNLKIADFGFAKKCPSDGLRTMCGTPGYVAPEILERHAYNTQCDMWSLGVIVYILLGGYSPFEEKDQNVLFDKIRAADYTFHEEFWDPVSPDAKDFIRALLNVNPNKRLTASKALNHTWMKADGSILASMDLGANLTELKRFNAKRKFKAAVKTVIATQKLTSLFV